MAYLPHTFSVKCPACRSALEVEINVRRLPAATTEYEALLEETWEYFLLWNFLGKPAHGYEGKQYWYDPYHRYVEFEAGDLPGQGMVYFAIQIADSVDGDTWLLAKVPLEAGRLAFEKMEHRLSTEPDLWQLKGEK